MTSRLKSMPKLRREWVARLIAMLSSGVIGVLIWSMPIGQALETDLGLLWSFKIRGAREAPTDVVVVPISEKSARKFSQPSIDDLDEWDRSLFAEVVNRLTAYGASVIVFDIAFGKQSKHYPKGDDSFVKSISDAGNVVLLRWLDQIRPEVSANNSIVPKIDRLVDPAEMFSKAAAAKAPWLLYEGEERISRFPTFPYAASRITPTLPVVALYLHYGSRADSWSHCLMNANDPLMSGVAREAEKKVSADEELATFRAWFTNSNLVNPIEFNDLQCKDLDISRLTDLFTTGQQKFFNYYGEPGVLTGLAFHDIVRKRSAAYAEEFKGKVVFIGVSENEVIQPVDNFNFVFRAERGVRRISGVELAATAFANLLHNDDIKRIDSTTGSILLLVFGMAAGFIGYFLPSRPAIVAAVVLCVLYVSWTQYLFVIDYLWLPLVIPLLIQTPLALALGWQLRYLKAKHGKQLYGQYIPEHATKRIDKEGRISTDPKLLYAICLHSDISGYTILSERYKSDPEALKRLEIEYWNLVHKQIASENGERLEISGDGMTCIWAAEALTTEIHQQACRAAIMILRAVGRFNQEHPDTPFNTRIGLHTGRIALGTIGGEGQYTLTVGGDVANMAARLESDVNKLMKTRLAVSEEVLRDLEGVKARKLGTFILRGRTSSTNVFELLDESAGVLPIDIEEFHRALSELEKGELHSACELFGQHVEKYPNDAPSEYYYSMTKSLLYDGTKPKVTNHMVTINMNDSVITPEMSG